MGIMLLCVISGRVEGVCLLLHLALAAKAGLLALMPLPTEANQALQMHEILSSGKCTKMLKSC